MPTLQLQPILNHNTPAEYVFNANPVTLVPVLSIRKSIMPGLRGLTDALLGIGYPSACRACNAFCDDGQPFCATCNHQLINLESSPACMRCGKPLAEQNLPCPWCKGKGLYPFDRIAAMGIFTEPLRSLIHQIKYHKGWPLAEILACRLAKHPRARDLLQSADLILPVPLHIRRQFTRGYNQSLVIARELARHSNARIARSVLRIRHTPSQTDLTSMRDRHENVRGAFSLRRPERISGKRIIVVDDVTTSGATLQAVGRTLLPAKPASISAIVLAIADPRHRDFEMI